MTQRQNPTQSRNAGSPSPGRKDRGVVGPATYSYVAYSPDQKIAQGVIKASSAADADASLRRAGYRPVLVRPVRQSLSLKNLLRSKRVKPVDVLILTEQLAVLLRSGVPLVTSLEALHRQFRNPELKRALEGIAGDVGGGTPLSEALGKYPHIFSSFYTQMVVLGERSGDLEGLLEQTSKYVRREMALRSTIKRALFYPVLVLVLALVVVVVMVKFVLPRVLVMFDALKVPLPTITRITLGASKFINDHQSALGAVFILLVLGLFLALRLPRAKAYLHRAVLRLPLLSTLVIYRELGRFSRVCGLMLRNGLPLPMILTMTAGTAGNLEVKKLLRSTQAEVTAGNSLSASLSRASFIPPMFKQMLETGELSGNLEGNLTALADFYDRELDALVQSSVALLEPVLTIVVGVIIGFVALTIVMPIYSIVGSMGG